MGQVIDVVGAAIVRGGSVLCVQRGEGRALAGKWEFPGGKIESGESPEQALVREIREELLCDINVGECVGTCRFAYDFGTVILTVYLCRLVSGTPQLTEHRAMKWVKAADMPALDWAPADIDIVNRISHMSLL